MGLSENMVFHPLGQPHPCPILQNTPKENTLLMYPSIIKQDSTVNHGISHQQIFFSVPRYITHEKFSKKKVKSPASW